MAHDKNCHPFPIEPAPYAPGGECHPCRPDPCCPRARRVRRRPRPRAVGRPSTSGRVTSRSSLTPSSGTRNGAMSP